jgi:methylated-DNA-[protein]-cysteine S-methyltransferase
LALFDTAIGRCAIAWTARGVVGVQLPEASDAETVGRLKRRLPRGVAADPPPEVERAIAALQSLVGGDRSVAAALAAVPLDERRLPEFDRRAYALLRQVAPGETTTYGDLARLLDAPGAAQAIGRAMARNPFVLLVPCHRVLASGDEMGGFSGPGGVAQKRRLLEIEGAAAVAQRSLF